MDKIFDGTIYFCYAKEDKLKVDEIYIAFREAGLQPWMDDPPSPYNTEGLPPGADWDNEFRQRIEDSEVFMPFLSNISVKKQGYVQTELRLALQAQMKRPQNSQSLKPVLLEPCKVPDVKVDTLSLSQFHWYEWYKHGSRDLIRAVKGEWGVPARSVEKMDMYLRYLEQISLVRELGIKHKTFGPATILGIAAGQKLMTERSKVFQLREEIQLKGPKEIDKVATQMAGMALLASLPLPEEKLSTAIRLYEREYKPKFLEIARRDCGVDE